MSEEAVRQTRSQKRALERDAPPQAAEPPGSDSESKKPKLDPSEPTTDAQTKPETHPAAPGSDLSRTKETPKHENGGGQGGAGPGEQPVDMSTSRSNIKREKRPPSPEDDDVIILSDNDSPSPPMNGLSHFKELDTDLLMRSSPAEREQIIKQLKEELRIEEAKLVLLKKLRQSQIQRDNLQKPSSLSSSSAPPPLIRGTITSNKGSQQVLTGRSSGTVIPPPLVRGGQQGSSKHGSQVIMPPLVRGAQQIQALPASGASGPPPLLLGPRTSAPAGQGQRAIVQSGLIGIASLSQSDLCVCSPLFHKASSSSLKGSSTGSSSSISVVSVNDSPASRQAAAKLALRKQLEKTLLEIPPPKPPAPEFSFLPSAANNEFIYLVGLEEVVQNLLDTIHRGKTGVALSKLTSRDPFICSQCNTDFTCRWRQDKAKGGLVLCEQCMSSNQKKALKAEHTNRLKGAFVKALQQEQEIERRIYQQTSSSVSHGSSPSSSLKAEQLVSQQLKQAQAQARASSLHHHQSSRGSNMSSQGQLSHGVSSVGVRGLPHTFSSSSQLQSAVAAAALVSRPGKHGHVSHHSVQSSKIPVWSKITPSLNTGVTMAYVNPSLTGHKTSATVDARQREYLLDMIPSRSSLSQTANTWK
uniref:GATA zinc finger domain containing 2A n=1 Tax=Tetraodon nigroviridis TaxID=99883 RepID=H3DCX8_TETNG